VNAVLDSLPDVFKAFGYTILLFLVSGAFSLLGGTLLVAMRVGPIGVLNKVAVLYVTIVRNTPLLAVLFFFSFAGPIIGLNFKWVSVHIGTFDFTSFFSTAAVAMTVYTSAFVCEALRSGVNAVALGQAEAARAIGLPFAGVMRQVVLPQAVRASVPPVASTMIALLKNTSVAAVFGVIEAAAQMKIMTNNHADERWGIFLAFAIGYVVLVELVSLLAGTFERRWRIA
jgi:glutamate transport system permease protein